MNDDETIVQTVSHQSCGAKAKSELLL